MVKHVNIRRHDVGIHTVMQHLVRCIILTVDDYDSYVTSEYVSPHHAQLFRNGLFEMQTSSE